MESAPAIQHGHIDAAVLIAVPEFDPVGFMEQVGIQKITARLARWGTTMGFAFSLARKARMLGTSAL